MFTKEQTINKQNKAPTTQLGGPKEALLVQKLVLFSIKKKSLHCAELWPGSYLTKHFPLSHNLSYHIRLCLFVDLQISAFNPCTIL